MAKQKFQFQSSFAKTKEEDKREIDNVEIKNEEKPIVGNLVEKLSQKKEKAIFEIKSIPRNMISENKKNQYPKEKLDNMKDSILHFGLQQNLTVVYLKGENEYIIEAGHTRKRALDELIEEFADYTGDENDERYQLYLRNVDEYSKRGYPCRVADSLDEGIDYYSEEDLALIPEEVIDSEIRLIITNEIKRDESPVTKAKNVARLDELYRRKNIGKKKDEKINIKEQIASDLNMSPRQVMNYKSVGKLIPGLQKAFDESKISLKDSSNYAQLSEEDQELILTLVESGKKVNEDEVRALKQEKNRLQEELKGKENALMELYNEMKELENEKENLSAELAKKESAEPVEPVEPVEPAEPIIVPDPEIERKLHEKEKEVSKLKEEISKMKQQSESKKKLDAAQSEVVKNDMALRSSFEDCKRAIRNFIEMSENLSKSYGKVNKEDLDSMAITTEEEIERKKKQLLELIQSIEG